MSLNGSPEQQRLNLRSSSRNRSQRLSNPYPSRMSPPSSNNRRRRLNVGSPPPTGRLLFGSHTQEDDNGSPPPTGRLLFGFSDENSYQEEFMFPKETNLENSQNNEYIVIPNITPPPVPNINKPNKNDIKLAVPVLMFLSSLHERGVLSSLPNRMTKFYFPSTPKVGSGSFTTAFHSPTNPNCVVKISELGTNGKRRNGDSPRIDNKGLLELLIASNKCLDDPNCAKVSEVKMYQTPDGSWRMWVEQEKCSLLTYDDAKAILECFIALLRKFLPTGVYPKDFKVSNFGKNASGRVVWFDYDFGTLNKKKRVPSVVSSGDFQIDGNEQFKRMLLALIELFCHPITSFFHEPLVKDRKDVFRVLNQQKGVLQRYRLLSSDKSIFETTLDDFTEVLRKIGLSEEDNAYLVGLLTPPASSE